MKKQFIVLFLGLFLLGCGASEPKKAVLAKVNNYEITAEEFNQEFKDSNYAAVDTPQSRKEFLNVLISRKLILQDAQARGLDKDKAFLKAIEKFWEQSLLKIYLDQKDREIADKAAKEGLSKERQTELSNEWITQLRKGADIKVNQEVFNE